MVLFDEIERVLNRRFADRYRLEPAVDCLRASGKGQIESDGFEWQRTAIAKFAKASKLEVVDEFRDEGVSRTKELDGRPGLAALLDCIESNGVKVVIVESAQLPTAN